MKISLKIFLWALFCVPVISFAGTQDEKNEELVGTENRALLPIHTKIAASSAVAGTLLAKTDVLLARSLVVPKHISGDIGESIAGNAFMKDTLGKQRYGNWKSLSPRSGRQGLDHLFIKTDKNGLPKQLMVAESKYGNSNLGITKDGVQMSPEWTNKRLRALGSRYSNCSKLTSVSSSKPVPLNANRSVDVVLKNGKMVSFWAESSTSPWNFSGTQAELAEAQNLAKEYGNFLTNAGNGTIKYRSRIFHIKKAGANAEISIYDASDISEAKRKFSDLRSTTKKPLVVENVFSENGQWREGAIESIAKKIKKEYPHWTDAEARDMAKKVAKTDPNTLMAGQSRMAKAWSWAKAPVFGVGVAVVLDAGFQLLTTRTVDKKMLALTGGGAAVGVIAGMTTQAVIMKSQMATNVVRSLASKLACTTSMMSSMLGGAIGGVATAAFVEVGMYLAGYTDLSTMGTHVAVAAAGTGLGLAALSGVLFTVKTFGVASTGTAISALKGIAATKATYAILGGGTLKAGGFGVLGGGVVAGGIVAGVAAAVWGGYWVYTTVRDSSKDFKRYKTTCETYREWESMQKLIEKSAYIRSLKTAQ